MCLNNQMDNNLVENAIRLPWVGRTGCSVVIMNQQKCNHYVFHVGMCKARGVNFRDWLVFFLNNIHQYVSSKTQIKQNRLQPPAKFFEHFGESLKDYSHFYRNKTGFTKCLPYNIISMGCVINSIEDILEKILDRLLHRNTYVQTCFVYHG